MGCKLLNVEKGAASVGASIGARLGAKTGPIGAGIGAGLGAAGGYIADELTPSCPCSGGTLMPDGGRVEPTDTRDADATANEDRPRRVEIPVTEA